MKRTVKERAAKVLELVQKCATNAPEVGSYILIVHHPITDMSIKILDGDGLEHTHDTPEEKALMRELAAASIVLLKNDNAALPLKPKVRLFSSIVLSVLSLESGARYQEDRHRWREREGNRPQRRRVCSIEAELFHEPI